MSIRHAGERVSLRPAMITDLGRFAAILAAPSVAQWWPTPPDDAALRDEFFSDSVVTFAIEVQGVVAGFVQYREEGSPDYRSAGIDIALDPEWQGHGLGADALRTLVTHLFEDRGHHRLTIDPAAANARAIACYRRIGFRPVGVMRQYERGADGSWHDGLLMELLRDDFTRSS
jgi:aminoglycoside 6'-N-acetyltransferase